MRVVVAGAGVVGLATSLLLARDGHEVTVLEQDGEPPPPEPSGAWDAWQRRGVAQWRQPHNVFPRFQRILDTDLPDVREALLAAGCGWSDPLDAPPPLLSDGGTRRPGDEQFRFLCGRRPVLEAALAGVVGQQPGVDLVRGASVDGLLLDDTGTRPLRVRGVHGDGQEHRADLVVDAMGRTSRVAGWLAEHGAQPAVVSQDRGFVYYTRYFRGERPARLGPGLCPIGSLSVLTIPADGDTWSVTLFGTAHDSLLKRVRDEDRFSAVLRACPLQAHWLDGEPLTGVLPMGGVLDRHRRYVVDDRPLVTGLLAVGDAWACTNPSAGRGLSVGLVHAQLLRDVLRAHPRPDEELAAEWDTRTEEVVGPFFRNQQESDRLRIAEMEAHRDGTPLPEPDRLALQFAAAATVDPDAWRGLLEMIFCLALPEQVMARPEVQAAMQRVGDALPEPFPGPSRRDLVALLS